MSEAIRGVIKKIDRAIVVISVMIVICVGLLVLPRACVADVGVGVVCPEGVEGCLVYHEAIWRLVTGTNYYDVAPRYPSFTNLWAYKVNKRLDRIEMVQLSMRTNSLASPKGHMDTVEYLESILDTRRGNLRLGSAHLSLDSGSYSTWKIRVYLCWVSYGIVAERKLISADGSVALRKKIEEYMAEIKEEDND